MATAKPTTDHNTIRKWVEARALDWDDWFEKFDEENLAFLHQDKRNSRFSKLVRR